MIKNFKIAKVIKSAPRPSCYRIFFQDNESQVVLANFLSNCNAPVIFARVRQLIQDLIFYSTSTQNEIEKALYDLNGIDFYDDIELEHEKGQIYWYRWNSTGFNLGRIASIYAPEYSPRILYNHESKKIYLISVFDTFAFPLTSFGVTEFLKLLDEWKEIIVKLETGELKLNAVINDSMTFEECNLIFPSLDPFYKPHEVNKS
jgi:hypothetical protein